MPTRVLNMVLGCGFLLTACGVPSEKQVIGDFARIARQEIGATVIIQVRSVETGEGWSDTIYKHVVFDMAAPGQPITKGWLAGTPNNGPRLTGGEVILIYENRDGSGWKVTRYWLEKNPRAGEWH